jgi:hypothetical protein
MDFNGCKNLSLDTKIMLIDASVLKLGTNFDVTAAILIKIKMAASPSLFLALPMDLMGAKI